VLGGAHTLRIFQAMEGSDILSQRLSVSLPSTIDHRNHFVPNDQPEANRAGVFTC
jgi:hypothetical protein